MEILINKVRETTYCCMCWSLYSEPRRGLRQLCNILLKGNGTAQQQCQASTMGSKQHTVAAYTIPVLLAVQ